MKFRIFRSSGRPPDVGEYIGDADDFGSRLFYVYITDFADLTRLQKNAGNVLIVNMTSTLPCIEIRDSYIE